MIINSVTPLSCQQKNSLVEYKFQLKMQNYAYLCTSLKSRQYLKCASGQEIQLTFHYLHYFPSYPGLSLKSLIQSLPV